MEYKSLPLELTDIDREHRIAVIKHASYGNVDLVGDVSRKGMFDKCWKESKNGIQFRLDHDPYQRPGKVVDVWDDENGAFTKVQFNNTALGNDTLEMAAEGIITNASFGFRPIKVNKTNIKGRNVRELREVFHGETSLVYRGTAINPEAGVVMVKKSLDPEEFQAFVEKLKAGLSKMENFCRTSTASDECIKSIEAEVKAINQLLPSYDTANTTQKTEPVASVKNDEILMKLKLLNARL